MLPPEQDATCECGQNNRNTCLMKIILIILSFWWLADSACVCSWTCHLNILTLWLFCPPPVYLLSCASRPCQYQQLHLLSVMWAAILHRVSVLQAAGRPADPDVASQLPLPAEGKSVMKPQLYVQAYRVKISPALVQKPLEGFPSDGGQDGVDEVEECGHVGEHLKHTHK